MDKLRFKPKKIKKVNTSLTRTGNVNNSYHHVTNTRHAPGEIYIIIACGYHGIIPGCLIYRFKIGLTIDAKNRLKRLESIQAPCDYKLLKVIRVRDMAAVESLLHKQFSSSKVELKQSREWFDLNLWQLWCACQAFVHFENHPQYGTNRVYWFPLKAIALSIVGILIARAFIQPPYINHKPLHNVNYKNENRAHSLNKKE